MTLSWGWAVWAWAWGGSEGQWLVANILVLEPGWGSGWYSVYICTCRRFFTMISFKKWGEIPDQSL